jgi:dTDP-4-amino-4,6-dideoxygalactose transaminase
VQNGVRASDLQASVQRAPLHVPFVDLRLQSRYLREEYEAVFESIVERAAYTLGPEVAAFEEQFARLCGAEHAVGVSSGTDAVKLALIGAGVRPGDEVIVPVNTFIATAEAVCHVGAVPVFVDCQPDTANIDPERVEAAVSPRTTAIVAVHLYGRPADMDDILEIAGRRGLAVVEDACQAHGALCRGRPVGSMGTTAAFSFYPGKNLGALGDGGAVTTQDPEIAARLRLLRNHGQESKYTHREIGYCDRLHNLQAALLLVKLKRLPGWNAARRAAAERYDQLLPRAKNVLSLDKGDGLESVYHLYVVMVDDRDRVRDDLEARGVETGIHYPVPLHLQPAFAHLGHTPGEFATAERLADRILSLPMFPEITHEQIEHVVDSLEEVTAGSR